jgi:hypothetical protein
MTQAMQIPKIDWVAIEAGGVNRIGPHNTISEAMPTGYAPQLYYYDDYATTHRAVTRYAALEGLAS